MGTMEAVNVTSFNQSERSTSTVCLVLEFLTKSRFIEWLIYRTTLEINQIHDHSVLLPQNSDYIICRLAYIWQCLNRDDQFQLMLFAVFKWNILQYGRKHSPKKVSRISHFSNNQLFNFPSLVFSKSFVIQLLDMSISLTHHQPA